MWTCTACRLEFATFNDQKEHFRADWHRYNLKRKVVELPPVTEEQFNFRMQKLLQDKQAALENDPKHKQSQKREEMKKSGVKTMTKCVACNKSFTTANAYENHLTSKKHLANAKSKPEVASAVETIQKQLDIVSLDGDAAAGAEDESAKPLTDEEVALSLEEYKKQIPLGKDDCIFCAHKAEDFDANLSHMLKEHGFFIPDVEFLVDAEGLVGYLAEKVKLGNFCLYCNGKGKTFRDYHDVQKHMTALSHCKLPYDDDEDIEELVEFYDFSAQYKKAGPKAITAAGEGDDVEWETDSEASIDDDEEVVVEEEDEADSDDDDDALHTINVSETGELVLANGKRLGRREFRRYYRQRFRPEEARESVLAVTKERLLLAYQIAGVDPSAGSTALSLAFAANLLKKRNVCPLWIAAALAMCCVWMLSECSRLDVFVSCAEHREWHDDHRVATEELPVRQAPRAPRQAQPQAPDEPEPSEAHLRLDDLYLLSRMRLMYRSMPPCLHLSVHSSFMIMVCGSSCAGELRSPSLSRSLPCTLRSEQLLALACLHPSGRCRSPTCCALRPRRDALVDRSSKARRVDSRCSCPSCRRRC